MNRNLRPIHTAASFLASAKAVVLDFDGTIKDSMSAKADAFVSLFPDADRSIQEKIRTHHMEHGGVARTKKIPLYMTWAGISPSPKRVEAMTAAFSATVVERVVASPWMAGYEAISGLRHRLEHVGLISATPCRELSAIVAALDIDSWFDSIDGWPAEKATVVRGLAARLSIATEQVLVIGDSSEDEESAAAAGARFVNIGSRLTSAPTEMNLRWLVTRI